MEDFILYQEIGRGSHSVVYKGRKTGTLDYLTIQGVEKPYRKKAQNKFYFSSLLDHPNVLKTFKVCETESQNWVVSDYCPGGDLLGLLEKDVRLPEAAILELGLGIILGLQHAHSHGVVVTDLRPCKILVDNGYLKIGDLSNALNVLKPEILPDEEMISTNYGWLGSPFYLAPELHDLENALHVRSFASDLWALGIILYEMYCGAPPFVSDSSEVITKLVQEGEIPLESLSGASQHFVNLIIGLLRKNPWDRITWKEIAANSFFDRQIPDLPMNEVLEHFGGVYPGHGSSSLPMRAPSHIDYMAISHSQRTIDLSHGGDVSGSQRIPSPASEVDTDSLGETIEADSDEEEPTLLDLSDRDDFKDPYPTDAAPPERLLPLFQTSANVPDFLAKRLDFEQNPSTPNVKSNHNLRLRPPTGSEDVLETETDSPLPRDHNTHNIRASQVFDDRALRASQVRYSSDFGGNLNESIREKTRRLHQQQQQLNHSVQSSPSVVRRSLHVATLPSSSSPNSDPVSINVSSPSDHVNKASGPLPSLLDKPASSSSPLRPSKRQIKSIDSDTNNNNSHNNNHNNSRFEVEPPTTQLEDLYFHESDMAVTPIVGNQQIEKSVTVSYDAKSGGLHLLSIGDLASLPPEEQEHALAPIEVVFADARGSSRGSSRGHVGSTGTTASPHGSRGVLTANQAARQQANLLNYLTVVCGHSAIANIVVNSNLFVSLTKLLKVQSFETAYKEKLILCIGTITRNATLIGGHVNMGAVISLLSDSFRTNFQVLALRRKLIASLGEAMFYVATQSASLDSDEMKQYEGLQIPTVAFGHVLRALRDEEDPVVQHYAVKIIENVTSILGVFSRKFCSNETMLLLWTIGAKTTTSWLKRSCFVCLSRLGFAAPALLQSLFDKLGLDPLLQLLKDPLLKIRQSAVNILLVPFLEGKDVPRLQSSLLEDERIIPSLMGSMDVLPAVLRAKVYLLFTALTRGSLKALFFICDPKLFTFLEKDFSGDEQQSHQRLDTPRMDGVDQGPSGDEYLRECGSHLYHALKGMVPELLYNTQSHLSEVAGRKHPNTAQIRVLKHDLKYLVAVKHALACHLLRNQMVHDRFLEEFCLLVRFVSSVIEGETSLEEVAAGSGKELVATTISILELVAQSSEILLAFSSVILRQLVPNLSLLLRSSNSAIRLTTLELVCDIYSTYLNFSGFYLPLDQLSSSQTVLQTQCYLLKSSFEKEIVTQLSSVLKDEYPIPTLASKLLYLFFLKDPSAIAMIENYDLAPQVVCLLQPSVDRLDSPGQSPPSSDPQRILDIGNPSPSYENDPTHIVILAHELVCSPAANLEVFCSFRLPLRAARSLVAAFESGSSASILLSPLLEILHVFLKYALNMLRTALQLTSSMSGSRKTVGNSNLTSRNALVQASVQDIAEGLDALAGLLVFEDETIGLMAIRCLSIFLQLSSRDGPRLFTERNLSILVQTLHPARPAALKMLALKVLIRTVRANDALVSVIRGNKELVLACQKIAFERVGSNSSDSTSGLDSDFLDASLSSSSGNSMFSGLNLCALADQFLVACQLTG